MGSMLLWLQNLPEDQLADMKFIAHDPESVNWSNPMTWTAEKSPMEPLLASISEPLVAAEDAVARHLGKHDNKHLRGTYNQLDASVVQEKKQQLKMVLDSGVPEAQHVLESFAPFACGVRLHTMRQGTVSWPLNGFGAFVYAGKHKVGVAVLDLAQVVEKTGLQLLEQLDKHLDDKKGPDLDSIPVALLTPGMVLWVPFGCICWVTGKEDISTFTVWPWASQELRDKADAEAWELCWAPLAKHAKKKKDEAAWQHLAEPINAFGATAST